MSLILEALKKSEAERRLGQVPGLMTPVQRTAPARRARWPLPVAIVLVLVLALLGAGGWWWTQQRGAPADEPIAAPAAPAAAPAQPSAPASLPATPDAHATTAAAPAAATPAVVAPPPAELPRDPDFASVERESMPVTPDTPPPSEPPPRPLPPRTPPVATNPAPADTPAAPATAEPLPVPTRVAPTASEADAALEPLPRLQDLTAAERENLPPLKLSMHVYAADPAARFVLIDGDRLGEGAEPSRGLRLAEIRRDGAVFEFDGRRFLVPRL